MTTFGWRIPILTAALSLAALAPPQGASQRSDVNALKKGVVRIRNTRFNEVGTGIVVKVTRAEAYIVTAAHVVRGDESPEVYLFTRQREPLRAKLLNREQDGDKGLALLWLRAEGQELAGLTALDLGTSSGLDGGEEVTLLGFPGGTSIWTVTKGTVARREGREVVFTGPVTNGNSGGPLLLGGRVVGLVTDTKAADRNDPFSYAAQAESVAQYIRGIEPNELANLSASPTPTATPRATPTPTPTPAADEFCTVLTKLLVASEDGFRSIKGKSQAGSDKFNEHTIYLPGSISGSGWVWLDTQAYYVLSRDKDKKRVEAELAKVLSKVRGCLPNWEQKETRSSYTFYKFREGVEGKAIIIVYRAASSTKDHYYLAINIYPRGNKEW